MEEELKKLIEELVELPGPSGFEDEVAQWMENKFKEFTSQTYIDEMGNVIAAFKGKSQHTIMITAHMDEISLVVEGVEDGMVYIKSVGWIDESVLAATPVNILTSKGIKEGIVRAPSAHLKEWIKESPLFVDVGGETENILPGDPVIFASNKKWLSEEYLASKALDDRVGCAILIQLAAYLAQKMPEDTIYLAGAVQEEVKCRGAIFLARTLQPDFSIVIDTVYGADPTLPAIKTKILGSGPVIRRFEQSHSRGTIAFMSRKIEESLSRAAEELKIPYSYDIAETFTDSSGILGEIPQKEAISINIARRYSHSPYEVVNIKDVAWCRDIILNSLKYL